jgi:hypothetical protein
LSRLRAIAHARGRTLRVMLNTIWYHSRCDRDADRLTAVDQLTARRARPVTRIQPGEQEPRRGRGAGAGLGMWCARGAKSAWHSLALGTREPGETVGLDHVRPEANPDSAGRLLRSRVGVGGQATTLRQCSPPSQEPDRDLSRPRKAYLKTRAARSRSPARSRCAFRHVDRKAVRPAQVVFARKGLGSFHRAVALGTSADVSQASSEASMCMFSHEHHRYRSPSPHHKARGDSGAW